MGRRISFEKYQKGDAIPELEVGPLGQMDLVRYAGASGDFNPIHNDVDFAKRVGLGGTVAHGMYVMAMLGRLATNWVHPAQLHSFAVKFRGMTRPGETLHCSGKVKKKAQEGDKKLLTVSIEAAASGETKASGDIVILCD